MIELIKKTKPDFNLGWLKSGDKKTIHVTFLISQLNLRRQICYYFLRTGRFPQVFSLFENCVKHFQGSTLQKENPDHLR